MSLDFVDELANQLEPSARWEFTTFRRGCLRAAMKAVGMDEYPPPPEGHGYQLADHACLCKTCGKSYAEHPMDWRVIGFGNVPFLNVLCDGQRVKL